MIRLRDFLISERTVLTVIVINTIALFILGRGSDSSFHDLGRQVDYACVVFFIIEAILKVQRGGWRQYWSNGWNRFDFFVVVFSAPAVLAPWVPLERLSAITVLRVSRLLRLFRLLRFIPNRDHLIAGSQRALRASVGVLLALLLVNIVLGFGAMLLFGQFAPEHFGDPVEACYSMFRVFTVEGWYELPDLIGERAGHPGWQFLARAYFMVAVVVGGLIGLSLANAVFVDEMVLDNNDSLEAKIEELHAEIRALRSDLAPSAGREPDLR